MYIPLRNSNTSLESDYERVKKLLRNREQSNELVLQLISKQSSRVALEIRFLTGLQDFKSTIDREQRAEKGKILIELFFSRNSRYRLEGLPISVEKDLLRFKLEKLEIVENIMITELMKSFHVMKFLNHLEES